MIHNFIIYGHPRFELSDTLSQQKKILNKIKTGPIIDQKQSHKNEIKLQLKRTLYPLN